ncbi:hypothetical protein ABZP36_010680 [Zizania latifolia]
MTKSCHGGSLCEKTQPQLNLLKLRLNLCQWAWRPSRRPPLPNPCPSALVLVDAASGGGGLIFAKLRSTILATAVALSSCAGVRPNDAVLLVTPNYMLYLVCFFTSANVPSHPISPRLAVMSLDPPRPLLPRSQIHPAPRFPAARFAALALPLTRTQVATVACNQHQAYLSHVLFHGLN